MLISLRSDGTAVMLLPSHVYQGSNVANVFVIAPFPNTTVLQVGFTLPNGTTASAPMTYVQDSENNLVVWQYTISSAITNEAGAASVSITATTQTGQVIASQSIPFTIEATTLPVLPDTPSQDEYTLILQYIQQNSANITIIQGQISTIEEDVATANTNASAAVTTANAAQQTAQTALTTANGLAASIAQANTNASEALSTANQAASAAASNTTGIANIVNGTTTVAKADSANSATNATNATNDGNGNNIANTYATKTELSTGNADTLAAAQNYTNQALANYSIIEIVQTLPETGDTGKIYLVPKADSTSGDLYSEYLWNGTEWELVGTVSATSGTTIKVNGVSQIEVDFTSDPQTQITANSTAISNIVDGTTTVPNATKATQDGDGNVIDETYATVTALGSETSARQSADTTLQNNINAIVNGTTPAGDSDKLGGVVAESYAQLSQVVRTDTPQSLTSAQQQQAQQNIGCIVSQVNTGLALSQEGWYNLLKFSGVCCGKCLVYHGYYNNQPLAFGFDFSFTGNYGNDITITNFAQGSANQQFKLRFAVIENENYLQIYYPYSAVNNIACSVISTQRTLPIIVLSQNVAATPSITYNETAVTSQVLKIDPTTLTPSTDNGWTEGDLTTNLSAFEPGEYYVCCTSFTSTNSTAIYSYGTVVVSGKANEAFNFTIPNGSSGTLNFVGTTSLSGYFDYWVSHTRYTITAATLWFKKK